MNNIVYWLPRILSVGFVFFLSLFSLDVFSQYGGWDLLLPLFIHLIPSLVLLVVVLIAWRYALVGTISFMGFALWYIFMVGFDRHWSWYAGISAPAAVVGILFLVSYLQERKKRQGTIPHSPLRR